MSGGGGGGGGGVVAVGAVSGGDVAGGFVAGGSVAGGVVAGAAVGGGLVAGGAVAGGTVGGGAAVVVPVAWPNWANSSSFEKTSPLDPSSGVPVDAVTCWAGVNDVVELGVVGTGGASDVVEPVELVDDVAGGAASAAETGAGSLLMKPPMTPAVPRALMVPTICLARLAGWRRAEKGFI